MRYRIINRERINDKQWNVTYERWKDCECEKKEFKKIVTCDRFPTLKDLFNSKK